MSPLAAATLVVDSLVAAACCQQMRDPSRQRRIVLSN